MLGLGRVSTGLLRSCCSNVAQRHIASTGSVLGIKSRWRAPMLRELKHRHDKMKQRGLLPVYKRSNFIEWNYDAELYAFGKRLSEEFEETVLREALTHPSYIAQETRRQESLGVATPALQMKSNSELAASGAALVTTHCSQYLRAALPSLPEEGVSCLVEYLTSEEMLSGLGSGIGLQDLLLCEIENPLQLLMDILERSGYEPPEPRLIFHSGQNTIEAVYHVGLYCSRQFLGSGYGETVETAVTQAALDVVRRLFHITEAAPPLPLGSQAHKVTPKTTFNTSLQSWSVQQPHNIFTC